MTTKSRIPFHGAGIISMDRELTADMAARIAAQFKEALRQHQPIVTGPGVTYTPFAKPKPSIRPSWADRGHK